MILTKVTVAPGFDLYGTCAKKLSLENFYSVVQRSWLGAVYIFRDRSARTAAEQRPGR